jgi:hypothetical protein
MRESEKDREYKGEREREKETEIMRERMCVYVCEGKRVGKRDRKNVRE